ncbi:MAG: hypothetical protein H7196_00795 [candidate division SR1 bacterium]|nr:hypothetical protein [candidate division SR1 bacterium]
MTVSLAATGIPDLLASSDSGSDNTENVMNTTTPPSFDILCEFGTTSIIIGWKQPFDY